MSHLNDSIKTPIVYLYNEAGNLLTSSMEGLDLGIVDFTYEYDDEEEELCTIKIQAKHHDAIDSLNIRRNAILSARWGYIGGPLSNQVKVAVRDIASKYGTNIIYSEYKCTDLTTFLKLNRSEDIRTMSIIDYLDNYASRSVNIVIQSGPDVIYKQGISMPAPAIYTMEASSINPSVFNPMMKYTQGGKPYLPKPERLGGNKPGMWYTDIGNDIKKYLEQDRDMISINRSPYNVLQEYLNTCPQGPWFITGRGDTLFIHNRNLGNNLYKNYIYAGESGELMDFTAETKYENFEKQKISSLTLDPISKGTESIDIYLNRLSTQKSFKEIVGEYKTLTEEERANQIKDFIIAYHDYKMNEIQVEAFKAFTRANPNISNYQDAQIAFNTSLDRRGMSFDEDSGVLAKKAYGEYILVPEGKMNVSPLKGYMGKVLVYSIPIEDPLDAENEQSNILRKLEMETEEANIIVEGDPNLMSEMVVGVLNIQKTHEGRYYIKKCSHNITEQGYRTSLETLKVKDSAIIKSLKTKSEIEKSKENEISMKLPEFFLKQEQIFKRWNVQVTFNELYGGYEYGKTGTGGYKTKRVDTLDSILAREDINTDQKWAVIKKYLEDPKYQVYFNERPITNPKDR